MHGQRIDMLGPLGPLLNKIVYSWHTTVKYPLVEQKVGQSPDISPVRVISVDIQKTQFQFFFNSDFTYAKCSAYQRQVDTFLLDAIAYL